MYGVQKHGLPLLSVDLTLLLSSESVNRRGQHQAPSTAPLPMGTNQPPGGRLITLDLCLHRGGRDSPSLEYICFVNVESPSLNIIFQPAVPSVYLQNALSIIMVFRLARLLIQEPISQLRKYSMGLMLMESTGLNTHIPSPRSRWPNWELEGLIENSVLVPVGRQYPKTK